MTSGIMQASYPLGVVVAAGCAAGCAAVSGRMLLVAGREGLTSQAWLAAVCFAMWSALAAVYFWAPV
jgi:hypothetical protein